MRPKPGEEVGLRSLLAAPPAVIEPDGFDLTHRGRKHPALALKKTHALAIVARDMRRVLKPCVGMTTRPWHGMSEDRTLGELVH